jgi:site-specific DNA recombinase
VKPTQGKHPAIISIETFWKIQDILSDHAKQPFNRKSINEDFPIRGFVLCPYCDNPYTASWSSGRNNKYLYYRCNNKECVNTQKSIPRDRLEEMFATALKTATPSKQIISLTKAITIDLYNQKKQDMGSVEKEHHKELHDVEEQLRNATDKLIATTSETVQAALEKKIEELETQKRKIQQSIAKLHTHTIDFGTALNAVLNFMENPHGAWDKGDLRKKRLIQKLVFTRPIAIHPKFGIGTANLSLPFKILQYVSGEKNQLVEAAGIEPATIFGNLL